MDSQGTPIGEGRREKRPLLSTFDKIVLIIVLLIVAYFLSAKMGMPMKKVEEKVEWVD